MEPFVPQTVLFSVSPYNIRIISQKPYSAKHFLWNPLIFWEIRPFLYRKAKPDQSKNIFPSFPYSCLAACMIWFHVTQLPSSTAR